MEAGYDTCCGSADICRTPTNLNMCANQITQREKYLYVTSLLRYLGLLRIRNVKKLLLLSERTLLFVRDVLSDQVRKAVVYYNSMEAGVWLPSKETMSDCNTSWPGVNWF